MNKLFFNLMVMLWLVGFTSCSSDDNQVSNSNPLIGVWHLTAWNVEGGFDINNDGTVSSNLLNEIDCARNETLFFDDNGVVSLNTTFNPDLEIVLLNPEMNLYSFEVGCDTEGVISLATSYTRSESVIYMGETEAFYDGNEITIVFEDRLNVYNSDFTEIVETKDLTLVYKKQ
jgi:hypothetical protein